MPNLDEFKQKLWVSYLKKCMESFVVLEKEHNKGKEEIERIVNEARKEETDWRNVIDIFNRRFSVPFQLSVENQEDVILKSEGPNIKFSFTEVSDTKTIGEPELLRILSSGERHALYILHIIFEVEARRKNSQKTLFIVDDIADSFDYKNKYAIIEYLKDISLEDFDLPPETPCSLYTSGANSAVFKGFSKSSLDNNFYQILLSHNFDFFRTVCSRLDMSREHKWHTIKTDELVYLITLLDKFSS